MCMQKSFFHNRPHPYRQTVVHQLHFSLWNRLELKRTKFNMFKKEYIPLSDPMLPLKEDKCCHCKKNNPKMRCSRCKVIKLCDTKCLIAFWDNGHKKGCVALRKMYGNSDRLKPWCQVLRSRNGADICNVENLIPSEITTTRTYDGSPQIELITLAMGCHQRLGERSPIFRLNECLQALKLIFTFLFQTENMQLQRLQHFMKIGHSTIKLSTCAADHFSVVKKLTKEQYLAPYPLACIERWGNNSRSHHCRDRSDDQVGNW